MRLIDEHIQRGPLPGGGNGTDPHAQRNGMVLAYNLLYRMMRVEACQASSEVT